MTGSRVNDSDFQTRLQLLGFCLVAQDQGRASFSGGKMQRQANHSALANQSGYIFEIFRDRHLIGHPAVMSRRLHH